MKKKSKYSLIVILLLIVSFYIRYNFNEHVNPLALSDNQKEIFVTLQGRLILKLFPGPPEYSSIKDGDRKDYCWVLQLDKKSFEIAKTTPVGEPAQDLDYIMQRTNPDEVCLAVDANMFDFCNDYKEQKVICEGYLFHAHTAHHYTPILMDLRKISKK